MSSLPPLRPGPLARLAVAAIHFYQRRISRPYAVATKSSCRYTPTCSHYAELAYLRYGAFGGSWLTFWRLFRCTPWGGHGYDPVPVRRDGRVDPTGAPVHLPPSADQCEICARHGHIHDEERSAPISRGRARRAARRRSRGGGRARGGVSAESRD